MSPLTKRVARVAGEVGEVGEVAGVGEAVEVDDADVGIGGEQVADEVRSDEPAPAGDEYGRHARPPPGHTPSPSKVVTSRTHRDHRLFGDLVGTTRDEPPPRGTGEEFADSGSVRSLPLADTIISRSSILAMPAVERRDDQSTTSKLCRRDSPPCGILEDRRRLLVRPVVDDVLHDVGVAPGGHRLEEVAALGPAPVGQARGADRLLASRGHCGASNTTPFTPGFAFRIAVSSVPCPPPTSTIVPNCAKSYAFDHRRPTIDGSRSSPR